MTNSDNKLTHLSVALGNLIAILPIALTDFLTNGISTSVDYVFNSANTKSTFLLSVNRTIISNFSILHYIGSLYLH